MSGPGDDIVRSRLHVPPRDARGPVENLAMRFPALRAAAVRALSRLPPRSRLRRALLPRGIRLMIQAYNRRDIDLMLASYHPDVVIHPAPEAVETGLLEPEYRGHDGWRAYIADVGRVWSEMRFEPEELIDTGDRVVVLGRAAAKPASLDVPVMQTFASVHTWRDGLMIRQDNYMHHADALEAVGLGAG